MVRTLRATPEQYRPAGVGIGFCWFLVGVVATIVANWRPPLRSWLGAP